MESWLASSPFITGLVIGFFGSFIGAVVDFVKSRRSRAGFSAGGLMLVVAGLVNSLAGITAIVYSLVTTGSIWTALVLGGGVLIGFAGGFLLIAGVWIWLGNRNELA